MARLTKPLTDTDTDTEIKNAKTREKEYNLADDTGPMLRVRPTGSKLWLFNYYQPEKNGEKEKSAVLCVFGHYP